MLPVESYVYDNGTGGGDGNMTSSTDYVDSNSGRRPGHATMADDWRDRQIWTLVDDHTATSATNSQTRETYTYNTYDNLDDVTDVSRYWAATNWSPDWSPSISTDYRIGRSGAAYDSLGRVYQTLSYNPSGTIATVSNTWYDPDGNILETMAGGTQEFTKTQYDGLGDAIVVFDGYDPSGSMTWASAGSVSGDTILNADRHAVRRRRGRDAGNVLRQL